MISLLMGFHPFHMVTLSPWPLLGSVSVLSLSASAISFMLGGSFQLLVLSVFSTSVVASLWWRDVVRESLGQGSHSSKVVSGLQMGMILFILSEVMFFFSLFFGWFFIALVPDLAVGCCTPPVGVQPLSFLSVPLLNTMILLSSGVSVTWSHHSVMEGKKASVPLALTCLLGVIFLGFQCLEYYEIPFTISDSVYGSLFFITTGFHGIHVFVGSVFLVTSLYRCIRGHFSPVHHVGFEAAAWYWHFVDVVWLFLFVSIYWWGS